MIFIFYLFNFYLKLYLGELDQAVPGGLRAVLKGSTIFHSAQSKAVKGTAVVNHRATHCSLQGQIKYLHS